MSLTAIFETTAIPFHFKSQRRSVLLTNVGCSGTEHNLTYCCATEIPSYLHCQTGLYAGVRCMYSSTVVRQTSHSTYKICCRFSVR